MKTWIRLRGIADVDAVIAEVVNDECNAETKLRDFIDGVLTAYSQDETIPVDVRPTIAAAMAAVCVEHLVMLRTKQRHGDGEHIEFRDIADGWRLCVFNVDYADWWGPAGFAVIHDAGRPCIIVGMVFDSFRLHGIAIKGTEAIGERWPNVYWLPGLASSGFHARLVELGIARRRDSILEFIPKGERQ